MKIKNGFALRQFADQWIAVSVDELADTRNVLITLNKTAAFAWKQLQSDISREALIAALVERFDADEHVIRADTDRFLDQAREAGLLDE